MTRRSLFIIVFLGLIGYSLSWPSPLSQARTTKAERWAINEQVISQIITEPISRKALPSEISIPGLRIPGDLKVEYTIDEKLQKRAERLFKRYNPDYGVFVAIDPENGHVLSMVDSTRDGLDYGNLSMVNTFPAASVSKIITAVAAVNENKANKNTVIPFNGKTTTLYKKHVFNHQNNKYTRHYTLKDSFAKSVNSAFGRLGAIHIGGETMLEYAYRLGFNGRFSSDFQFDNGKIEVDTNDQWEVAEMSTGYTLNNTLSPLHAASIAATAVNGGNLIAPVVVSSITDPYGIPLYHHEKPARSNVMTAQTAGQLKTMMQETVIKGSARKSFKKLNNSSLKEVNVGGKTGSLTGYNPKGKYDWFVGFAEKGERKIAYAVLCINKEKWYVKSAQFARQILEYYYSESGRT